MIDIGQFVPEKEIDELYVDNPYYVVPDGEVGTQAFAVIREAAHHWVEAAGQGIDGHHAALSHRSIKKASRSTTRHRKAG
jgi:hypothetical protein